MIVSAATPIGECVDIFIHYMVTRRSSTQDTEVTYRSILSNFANSIGNDLPIGSITIHEIDEYADGILNANYRPKTRYNKLAAVRGMFKFLYSRGVTSIRPERIDLPRVVDEEANFLEPHELDTLIAACRSKKESAVIKLIASSGLRVSELVCLRACDVSDRSILVRKGKGSKPRITFMTDDAKRAVDLYRSSTRHSDYLLANKFGQGFSRQYIARLVSEVASRASIHKKITPHTLRHTFCTNLLRNGARVEDVQPMMGHSNIRTTMIYMHFTNDYLHQRYDEFMARRT